MSASRDYKRLSLRNKAEASWFVILEAREAMWKANSIHIDDVVKPTFFFNLEEDSGLWSSDTLTNHKTHQ